MLMLRLSEKSPLLVAGPATVTAGLKTDEHDHLARADDKATSMPVECQPLSSAKSRFIPIFHPLPELRMTAIGKHAGGLATDQANDANAVFEHAGVYHLMFQTDCTKDDAQSGGICVGGKVGGHAFSHLVSTDGAHWRRLPDALIPMNTSSYDGADGDCDRAYADDELRALRGCCASPAGARHVAQWTDVAQCEAALQPAVAAASSFARDFGKCLAQVGGEDSLGSSLCSLRSRRHSRLRRLQLGRQSF